MGLLPFVLAELNVLLLGLKPRASLAAAFLFAVLAAPFKKIKKKR